MMGINSFHVIFLVVSNSICVLLGYLIHDSKDCEVILSNERLQSFVQDKQQFEARLEQYKKELHEEHCAKCFYDHTMYEWLQQ